VASEQQPANQARPSSQEEARSDLHWIQSNNNTLLNALQELYCTTVT